MLAGIKVIELSRVLAGPLATMMLGDMGADVVKVERPGAGDETRGWGPPFDARGLSAYYLSVNRNKLSVTLDLDDSEDLVQLRHLVAEADVIVENFRRDALARRGLAPASVLEANPRLIWCTISGFADEGTRPGYDFVVQAEAGWMAITGEPDGSPMKVGVALADVIAGKDAAASILAALTARERGVLGSDAESRWIRISLYRSAAASLVNVAQNALVSGAEATRWGNAHANLCPYEMFATLDQPIVVAVGTDAQWIACAMALDLPELAKNASLATNTGRLAHRTMIVAALTSCLRSAPSAEWIARLTAANVPCGVVRHVSEVVRDAGGSPQSGMPPATPGSLRYPPPMLGEHTDTVRELGWRAFDQ